MHERRDKTESRDEGARTRRSDHPHTPHAIGEWMTTFNLRWVEHLKHRRGNGGSGGNGLAGA